MMFVKRLNHKLVDGGDNQANTSRREPFVYKFHSLKLPKFHTEQQTLLHQPQPYNEKTSDP